MSMSDQEHEKSGLSKAIEEDPEAWEQYLEEREANRKRIQDEARKRFSRDKKVKYNGLHIVRSGTEE